MCSALADPRVPDRDLATHARIRDAAIRVFGERGFAAGVRTIAAAAHVSPGLVNHHFGSKDGLRAACDAQIRELITTVKREALDSPGPAGMLAALAEVEDYAPIAAYVVRSFQSGGEFARALFEQMVADADRLLAEGVAAGRFTPSRDPAARARYLTQASVGSMLIGMQMNTKPDAPPDFRRAIRDLATATTLPALELYTEGLFTDRSVLDAFLDSQE
ncbi:TetR/AcrR family transcriptional regulator [Rhodococcus sp. D2-41]|uniref:TetR family transcriptional regulator n=1 Tax=Speluncibacter jeojiensis TaxID=2710754 RepID=A0A9X4RDV2_9ACTN|nr:TetR family transcriptional regulator [Rhodococcus sp. D2-41]MDG3009776.1 TetR/AcrR family transcriptional regulator [Rhodococcus sp. D2-41]MDG3014527.1 TetR family transcriptional regulator [Corynebacteriales bacterium D3-21]